MSNHYLFSLYTTRHKKNIIFFLHLIQAIKKHFIFAAIKQKQTDEYFKRILVVAQLRITKVVRSYAMCI